MQKEILGAVGKIAGLAGLALGVFLLVFQGVLSKDIIPDLGLRPENAYQIIVALMILTFGIAAIGILCWLVSQGDPKKPVPLPALLALILLVSGVLVATVVVATPDHNAPKPDVQVSEVKPEPPQKNDCRYKENGIERYLKEFDHTQQTGWTGGGGQDNWCNQIINSLRREYPDGDFKKISSDEKKKNTCWPSNCPKYRYKCTVRVYADPLYKRGPCRTSG